jgi:hypothetical protein
MFTGGEFDHSLGNFGRAEWIMSDIRTAVRSQAAISFERRLAELRGSASDLVRRAIDEVPLALQHFFSQVSTNYTREPINYSVLLSQALHRGFEVAFATLNYETLLEQAASKSIGHNWRKYGFQYKTDHWQIAKLHGSVEWGYPWYAGGKFADPIKALEETGLPTTLKREWIKTGLRDLVEPESGMVHYPALALPIPSKAFVCPEEMEQDLQQFTKDCDGCLFIGYSGNDDDLSEFLKSNLPAKSLRVDIVSKGDVDEIAAKLRLIPQIANFSYARDQFHTFNDGFTPFVEDSIDQVLEAYS